MLNFRKQQFRLLLLAVILISVLSCDKAPFKSEDITLWGEYSYQGEFKMNGYFINQDILSQEDRLRSLVFYQNGIVYGLYITSGNLNPGNDFVESGAFNSNSYNANQHWGCFDVYGDIIIIEHPERPSPSLSRSDIITLTGKILNDSTIVLSELHRGTTGPKDETNLGRYEFHYSSTKPDSSRCPLIEYLGEP